MRKTVLDEVLQHGSYDTRKYRYLISYCGDHAEIKRLPKEYLDTTKAIDGWEVVKVIKK